jgi:hypothetical protein
MRIILLLLFVFALGVAAPAQIADMHAHLTNKHFMKDQVMPQRVIEYIERTGKLPRKYLRNWEQRLNPKRMKKGDSNFGNYFQTTYTGLQNGNYKIAVQSISPWEINLFHDPNYYFRNITRILGPVASHIPIRRYKTLLKTAPFTEAYTEYLYSIHQEMKSPTGNYKIYFPENADSLKAHINDPNTCITMLSYEGGHILFGSNVLQKKGFLRPTLSSVEKQEVLENIDYLKQRAKHKTFFITPVHFLWNTFAGQARALDKIELRKLLTILFRWRSLGKKLSSKFGSGLPPVIPSGDKEKSFVDTATCECPEGQFRVDNSCYKSPPSFDPFGKEVLIKCLSLKTELRSTLT